MTEPGAELISIVIPTFNRAKPVARALKSIQDQDYADWEAIVVDDGSTDDTVPTVAGMAAGDGRIRLIRRGETGGAQAARNTGIEGARGDWIAFLDSDDYLLPGSLRRRLETAIDTGADFVHSEALVLRSSGAEPQAFGVPPIEGKGFVTLLHRPGPMFQGMLVRRSALERAGPLDEKVQAWQEWDTALRLSRQAGMAFVAEPTFVYDCSHEDSVFREGPRAARGYARIVWKHLFWIIARAGPGALARHWQTVAMLNLRSGRWIRFGCYQVMAVVAAVFAPGLVVRRIRRLFAVIP